MTVVAVQPGMVTILGGLALEHGDRIEEARVAYSVLGPESAPVVVVMGGISAGRHVASTPEHPQPGWWEAVVGHGKAIDPRRVRIVTFDYLGGPGDSSAAPGTLPGPMPVVSTGDQARALGAVLRDLGVGRVATVVGASYGGMVALALAAITPLDVGRLVILSAAHRTHPMATALRTVQRDILLLGVRSGRPGMGVSLARRLAMTTYRTAEEFQARFPSSPRWSTGRPRFAVEDYLNHHGASAPVTFSPESFFQLSQSIDVHSVRPENIRARSVLMSVDSDALVPPWLMTELAERLGGPTELVRVASRYGHDAFLKEEGAVSKILERALTQGVDR